MQDEGGAIRGFALRTLWGFGPVIAPDPTDGALLLDLLRSHGSASGMRITVVGENSAAVAHLQSVGFQQERRLPRMVLGEVIRWRPSHVWTIFSFAIG